jgi:hypothetical protein
MLMDMAPMSRRTCNKLMLVMLGGRQFKDAEAETSKGLLLDASLNPDTTIYPLAKPETRNACCTKRFDLAVFSLTG